EQFILQSLLQCGQQRYGCARSPLQLVGRVEVDQGLLDTSRHRLFTLTDPDTRIKILLVGLVVACSALALSLLATLMRPTVRVSNLLHDVVLFVQHVVPDAGKVGVLEVSVEVDLDDAVSNGSLELLL